MQHLGGGEVWQRLKNDRVVLEQFHTRENGIKLSSICTVQLGGMKRRHSGSEVIKFGFANGG